ncbi:MAG: aromatic ring-hydroxylating dioxygenase subunit alpha [Acidimicrobiales bacterium]|nr:aromatic ring-hydroxylating dioxygenase subunit alpha [Acidimicrobiales bacterium]
MSAAGTTEEFWAGTRAPLNEATGLDPAAYTSDEFFAAEQRQLFGRAWVVVGSAPDVAAPGRMLVRQVGERSVVITRGTDGVLRGFLNSCRHRGTELAESDCDVAGTIRCPYHRWGYGLDGALVATPFFDDIPREEFDPADHGLIPVRIDTWGVLLFACLSHETAPLRDWLGDLPARMAGYELDGWRVQETRSIEIEANWKLISENFQEYYHLTWIHPELAKVSRVKDHYRYQGAGMYCGQTTTPVSGDERDDWLVLPAAAGLDESDEVSGRFVALFPNVLLSVLPNHVFVIQLDPTSPGQTTERCTFFLPPSTAAVSDDDMTSTLTFWFDVNGEDVGIVERGQRGLTRGAVPPGPLAPRFEEPLHRFHNMLADCMTLPTLASLSVPAGDDGSPESRLGTDINPHPPTIDL